jgi:hypothetical protein
MGAQGGGDLVNPTDESGPGVIGRGGTQRGYGDKAEDE